MTRASTIMRRRGGADSRRHLAVVHNVTTVSKFLSTAATAALLTMTTLLLTTTVVQAQQEQELYECQYSAPLQLDTGVRLEHYKNTDKGTLTMRLTYNEGLSWVSIGINSDGSTKMIPGTAIIGRMIYDADEITPLGSSVLRYDLVTDAEDGSGVVPMSDDMQTLMDATFVQDEEEWISTLTFTQNLYDIGLGPAAGPFSDTTSWLFAIGLPDNQWEGKHTVHGSFFLPLEDNCVKLNVNTPEVITDEEPHDSDPDETSVVIPGEDNNNNEEPEQEQPQEDEDENDVQEDIEPEQQPTTDDVDEDDPVQEEEEEEPNTVTNLECKFGEAREIYADKLMLEHYKNTEAGTYTMRLTYLAGSAWVSIGVNHEGSFKMNPSTCIIGRIEYDEDGITPIGSSVLKYDVTSTDEDASGVIAMADELQTLMDATFEQNGETSILTFTQKLVDTGMNDQPITDESSWIYAVGLPDNQWEGTHKVHGSFFMPLEENCAAAGAVADDAPAAADDEPVVDIVCSFVEPRELWVDKVKLEHYKNTDAGTYTMRLTYLKGNAWVSIGVNHEGSFHMAPSSCIIGRIEYDEDGITPIGSSVLKYDVTTADKDASGVNAMADEFQTLMNATFEQDGEMSVLTFTQKLDDSGMHGPITDETSWIYAIGLPDNQWEGTHKLHGSFFLPLEDNCVAFSVAPATGDNEASGIVMREDVTEQTFPFWVAHGWMMAIAWGVVGPLAIGAAMLRRLVGSNWYNIHFYLNMLCVVLTIVGFFLAVAAINKEEKPHFPRRTSPDDMDQVHHNAGLAIFIIVILQSVAGYFRPPVAPAPAAAPTAEEKEAKLLDDDDAGKEHKPTLRRGETSTTDESFHLYGKVSFDNDVILESTPESEQIPQGPPSNETSADLEGSSGSDATPQQKPKSPWVRKMWEMQHRLTGAVVVGLAWYNCHSGYLLMEDTYDESQNHTVVFWSVTGAIVGIIFILAYAVKM